MGIEKIDGVELHRISMTKPGKKSRNIYFDIDTGLYVRNNDEQLMDYRGVDGVRLPFRKEGKITMPSGVSHIMSMIVSIEENGLLDDSLFLPIQKP